MKENKKKYLKNWNKKEENNIITLNFTMTLV